MESHEPDLRAEITDPHQVACLQDDYRQAGLDPATRGLLDFAAKLTMSPRSMNAGDVEALRRLGFADEDVLDAVQLIAYFNYINRVLDGLGVQPDPQMRFRPEPTPP